MKKLRIYVDTCVFGGCFDEEFAEASNIFFEEVRAGLHVLVTSKTVFDELSSAPVHVKSILASLPVESLEIIDLSSEITQLRDAYLKAGIVGPKSVKDAEHIATATVAHVDMIVSWNFKHIVHFQKIRGYQSVNLVNGYSQISIHTPREVISYEK